MNTDYAAKHFENLSDSQLDKFVGRAFEDPKILANELRKPSLALRCNGCAVEPKFLPTYLHQEDDDSQDDGTGKAPIIYTEGLRWSLTYSLKKLSPREYDALKQQFEKTNNELSTSRRRCDHALSDLDYYREQHRAVMNQLEVSSQDSASLRTKYAELLNENKQLQAENQRLMRELHEHNGNTSDALYMSHTQALSKLEMAQDENARLTKQCDLLGQERAAAQRDCAGLKQQLVKLCKDYAKYREAHQKLQQQYEEAVNVTIKANKDIKEAYRREERYYG
ncbi:hypothetical protein NQ317_000626 [Molorchus minor]|uniref:Uncharacterized protein n=1 Tax=Molorchus minor TaxID=1323400 RepID=A0ABQ9JKC2_9CUCU|nr:hypothetical protein NQ317_000626 [Molorchus minor]